MDAKELRKKTFEELGKLLKAEREHVRDLRFRIAAKQHKDVRELREARQLVAQILTVLGEKRIVSKLIDDTKPVIPKK